MAPSISELARRFTEPLCTEDFDRSSLDTSEYRYLVLENGLRVMMIQYFPREQKGGVANLNDSKRKSRSAQDLVEDLRKVNEEHVEVEPEEDHSLDSGEDEDEVEGSKEKETMLSAAALCVAVGSFCDPPNVEGLAHLLEHMIFMGSKKYPEQNALDTFLAKSGGSTNASTDVETTVYQFEANEDSFSKALDIFAHFFVSPLLKKECLETEADVVDSEFHMSGQRDWNRITQIMCHESRINHPYHKFSWGSLESLITKPKEVGIDVLEELREFHRKYYVAHLMTLCTMSTLSLDEQEQMVRTYFKDLPVQEDPVSRPHFEQLGLPFDEADLSKVTYYQPVKERVVVELSWFFPTDISRYKSKPLSYISGLIGHEGRGSIFSTLRHQGKNLIVALAAGCTCAAYDMNSACTAFSINVDLSKEGLKNLDEVIGAIFEYIDMLREPDCPHYRLWSEQRTLADLAFQFSDREEAIDTAEVICEDLLTYEPAHILSGSWRYFEYREDHIREILNFLTYDKVRIVIAAKDVCNDDTNSLLEPHFGARYSMEAKPGQCPKNESARNLMHLPTPNIYIPDDISLLNDEPGTAYKEPKVVVNEPKGVLWYLFDADFNVPRASCSFAFFSPSVHNDIRLRLSCEIFVNILDHTLRDDSYAAGLAELNYELQAFHLGFGFKVQGFNDKMHILISNILDCAVNFDGMRGIYDLVLENLQRAYRNAPMVPRELLRSIRLGLLQEVKFTHEEMLQTLTEMRFLDFVENMKKIMSQMYCEGFIIGNCRKAQAISIYKMLQRLRYDPTDVMELPQQRVRLIAPGKDFLIVRKNRNPDDNNTFIDWYFQMGQVSIDTLAKADLLEVIMEEPCFDYLRTQEQLGYMATAYHRSTNHIVGYSVQLSTQATKFTRQHAENCIQRFLDKFMQELEGMDTEDFNRQKESLVLLKQHPDLKLQDRSVRLWSEIHGGDYVFDRQEKDVAALSCITKQDIVDFYRQHIHDPGTRRLLRVIVEGHTEVPPSTKHYEPLDGPPATMIDDMDTWKRKQTFYPPHAQDFPAIYARHVYNL
eukprot:Clim_evm59s150 gene=Clim_evmTU59s150